MLVDRKAVPDARHLVLDAHSEPRDAVLRLAGNVVTIKDDRACGRPQLAAEHLEERALAGAVRPDQAAQLPAAQAEIDPGNRMHPTKGLAQACRLQQRRTALRSAHFAAGKLLCRRVLHHAWRMPRLSTPRDSAGSRPLGSSNTNTTSSPPSARLVYAVPMEPRYCVSACTRSAPITAP